MCPADIQDIRLIVYPKTSTGVESTEKRKESTILEEAGKCGKTGMRLRAWQATQSDG
jgi:hypothetical protein